MLTINSDAPLQSRSLAVPIFEEKIIMPLPVIVGLGASAAASALGRVVGDQVSDKKSENEQAQNEAQAPLMDTAKDRLGTATQKSDPSA